MRIRIEIAPKRTRRGRKRGRMITSPDKLQIYYNNINGYASKKESLRQICKSLSPDIITLCETKLSTNAKPKIEGYEVIVSSCKKGKEGFLFAVKENTVLSAEKLSESNEKNILTVRITYPQCVIRVIIAHGPQETDEMESRTEFYEALMVEIERGQASEDNVIVVGDMNARIRPTESKPEEIHHASNNGKLLKELVEKYQLRVLNFHQKAIGKWTRIQNSKKGTEKSIIDYILVEDNLKGRVDRILIDEDKLYTPWRLKSCRRKRRIIFSDHTAIITTINITKGLTPVNTVSPPKSWIVTPEGLTMFKEITSEEVIPMETGDPTFMYQQWLNGTEDAIDRCFRRKRPPKHRPCKIEKGAAMIRKTLQEVAAKGKLQRELIKDYMKRLMEREVEKLDNQRVEKLKQTMESLSDKDKFSPNGYWRLKKSIAKKNTAPKLSSIVKNGIEITGKELIKEEVAKEFKHRLRNRQPDQDWIEYTHTRNEIVQVLMEMNTDNGRAFTLEELVAIIKDLKKKKTPGYDGINAEFLIEAGNGLLVPLLQIFNAIRVSKSIPEQWNQVLISLIYKNKGSKKELVNYRGIFLTIIVSKVFEGLLKTRMATNLQQVSPFQAGSRSNRGPPDNTFLLRGCIDHQKYLGRGLYITAYDFEQAFDSLWLQDCILSLKSLNVPDYILQLVHNLNQRATVVVKTPHGRTNPITVTDIVKQGGVLGSPICSASTAEYCGYNKGISIGTLQISSLAFVDDMIDVSLSCSDSNKAHDNALTFGHKKKIYYSTKKCKSLLANRRKNDALPNLMIGDEMLENATLIAYLGDIFNIKGDNIDLIKDRVKRGTTAMISIESMMADLQLGIHTVSVHLLLYQALFLSTVLFNSQAWSNLTKKDMENLRTVQLKLLKKIIGAPRSTSNAFTYLELGVVPIEYEIHQRQVVFLHHILNLEEEDPVKQMYYNQKLLPAEKNWYNNVAKLLETYQLTMDEDQIKCMSKDNFKKIVRKAIRQKAFTTLVEECNGQNKTQAVVYNELKLQDYLTKLYPWQSQLLFQYRSKTLDIKAHRSYKYSDLYCRWCNLCEEQACHIINCGEETIDIPDLNSLDEISPVLNSKLLFITNRIQQFLEKVDY